MSALEPIPQPLIDELRESIATLDGAVAELERAPVHGWATSEWTRYGIYTVIDRRPVQLGYTSKEGIGTALVQWREEGEINDTDRIGVLDGVEGRWVISPFARGR